MDVPKGYLPQIHSACLGNDSVLINCKISWRQKTGVRRLRTGDFECLRLTHLVLILDYCQCAVPGVACPARFQLPARRLQTQLQGFRSLVFAVGSQWENPGPSSTRSQMLGIMFKNSGGWCSDFFPGPRPSVQVPGHRSKVLFPSCGPGPQVPGSRSQVPCPSSSCQVPTP